MPDIAMCSSTACSVAGQCYRNPASGTVPDDMLQSWAAFEPERGAECDGYWPKSAPAPEFDVSHLETGDQPTADELSTAPFLDGWRIFAARNVDNRSLHFVIGGHVSGHPRMQNESKIRTSTIATIAADRRWVRTLNTLYLLGCPHSMTPLALHAAMRPTWSAAWTLACVGMGRHTVAPWVWAAADAAGHPSQSWPRRRSASAGIGDEMSRCGRSDIAAAWWNLAADPANRSDAGYVHERLVNAVGLAPSPEALTVLAGWDALAKGIDCDVDLSDSVVAARLMGERYKEASRPTDASKVIRSDDDFAGTDAFRELKIDIDSPSAIDELKPAAEPELGGVVVLPAIGGTTVTSVGKEVYQEFKSIVGRQLPLVVATDLAGARTALRNEFPHLHGAIDVLLSDFTEGEPLRLRPTLLVGPPGGGKSRLARRLAECLQVGLQRFDAASASDSTFGGTPRRWTSGEHCVPLEAVRRYTIANPIILVDEIDKAGTGRHNGNLANSLTPFLEIETSRNYPDPFVQSDVDLSHVSYLLTANDDTVLPTPLRDRLRIVRLPPPTVENLIPLIRGIIIDIAAVSGLPEGRRWYPDFDDDEISIAAQLWRNGSVRRLRAIVERMLAYREQNPRN